MNDGSTVTDQIEIEPTGDVMLSFEALQAAIVPLINTNAVSSVLVLLDPLVVP